MHRADEYLRRAQEAETAAQTLMQGEARRQMLQIAEQWRSLARQARDLAQTEEPEAAPAADANDETRRLL